MTLPDRDSPAPRARAAEHARGEGDRSGDELARASAVDPAYQARGAAGDPDLDLAIRIARWMDSRFLDPIIGLVVPGLGDVLTAAVGLFLVRIAARRGLPRVVIARMLLNLGIDTAIGAIPVVGDLFDFAWKANRRNVALLQSRRPGRSRPGDWIYVAGAALLFAAALAAPIALLVWAIRALW